LHVVIVYNIQYRLVLHLINTRVLKISELHIHVIKPKLLTYCTLNVIYSHDKWSYNRLFGWIK